MHIFILSNDKKSLKSMKFNINTMLVNMIIKNKLKYMEVTIKKKHAK